MDSLDSYLGVSQALVVADQGSISRVARILGARRSAVSRRILTLENELGVSLFERHSNGVRLTNAGKRFLGLARNTLADMDKAFANAAAAERGDEGLIRIGVLPSIATSFVQDILRAVHQLHPEVALEFAEADSAKLISRLMDHRLDVAFVVCGTPRRPVDVMRFRANCRGLAIFGYQWKPARLLIMSRSLASVAYLSPIHDDEA
ncbi:LysR family transcriptional regulator [Methylosinus sp. Sm6]|uniref:LysR family transcriptional regulator n=1 Tax=Methylosinus sp. Sm6 TaxID=2866948 RepID=UPI001C99BBC1|nr:LysR family transcriptional regulator [Methylosinus sp. Sm6]MBY6243785.1 LysR family transcriptional regulator [Methylosinus sp. Sm6]